jgi:tRNA pseudouridine65 synthase
MIYPEIEILCCHKGWLAVDKPCGISVHNDPGQDLVSILEKKIASDNSLCRQLGAKQPFKVYPVHRLDRPTSGVLLFALTSEVARSMGEAFKNKTIQKTYYALTRGHLLGSETIDYPLKEKLDKLGDKNVSRNKEPQQAQTAYLSLLTASLPISLGKFDSVRYSLIKLQPTTGRRHQIRRHLAHLRHPVIGDINYGDNKQNPFFKEYFGFKRLMLLAKKLDFVHPITNEKTVIEVKFDQQWHSVFDKLSWQVNTII